MTVGSDQTYTKIQDAINNADNGDTILIHNGTYFENVLVNKSLTLIGNYTDASGSNSFAGGQFTTASGLDSFAIGDNTKASGINSFAGGY